MSPDMARMVNTNVPWKRCCSCYSPKPKPDRSNGCLRASTTGSAGTWQKRARSSPRRKTVISGKGEELPRAFRVARADGGYGRWAYILAKNIPDVTRCIEKHIKIGVETWGTNGAEEG